MKFKKYHNQLIAKGIAPAEESGVFGVEMSYQVFPENTASGVERRNPEHITSLYDEVVTGQFGKTRLRGYIVDMKSLSIVIDHPDHKENKEHHFLYEARDGRGLYLTEVQSIYRRQLDVYTSLK